MAKNTEQDKTEVTFEQALAGLESVIRDLEDGRLGLTESLGRYEDGVRLLKHCQEALDQAERKILILTGIDAEGNPVTQPFDDAAMSLEEKKEFRGRRRSRGTCEPVHEANGAGSPPVLDAESVVDGSVDRQKGLF